MDTNEKKKVKVVKAKVNNQPPKEEASVFDLPKEEPAEPSTPKPKTEKKKGRLRKFVRNSVISLFALILILLLFPKSDNSNDDSKTSVSTQVTESTTSTTVTTTVSQTETDEGKVVYEDDNVKITVHSINKAPEMFGSIECPVEVTFFFENKTQRNIGLLLTNSYVNNMKISEYPFPSASTGYCDPGTTGAEKLLFSYNKFGINSYSEINSITTSFTVMDENDHDFYYETSPVTVNIDLED